MIYKINVISEDFNFAEIYKLILKFIWKLKGPLLAKIFWKIVARHTDFRAYYQVIEIKTM